MKISGRPLRCVNTTHTKEVAGGGSHRFHVAAFKSSAEVLNISALLYCVLGIFSDPIVTLFTDVM